MQTTVYTRQRYIQDVIILYCIVLYCTPPNWNVKLWNWHVHFSIHVKITLCHEFWRKWVIKFANEWAKQCRAGKHCKQVSGASEQASGQANGPVLHALVSWSFYPPSNIPTKRKEVKQFSLQSFRFIKNVKVSIAMVYKQVILYIRC